MKFIKLYIGDYLRDTGTLSVAEHGAYMLMLLHHYATERPLPEGRELHRLIRAETKVERDAADSVLGRFWSKTGTGWVNARAAKEFERADAVSETNREIAVRREAARRSNREHEQSTKRAQSVHEQSTNGPLHQTPDTRQPDKDIGGIPPKPPARGRARDAAPQPLPPWVDADAWAGFEAMRRAIRKPLTEAARRLAVAELAKLRDAGQDPTEVLRQSTFRSWAGLFPVKEDARTAGVESWKQGVI